MKRSTALLRREWIINRRDLTIYAAAIFLVLLGNETLSAIAARYSGTAFNAGVYGSLFAPFLFIGGIIATVSLFHFDLFKRENQHTFLMLPATNLEKFLSKSLVGTILYPVALTLFFVLSSLIIELSLLLIFKNPVTIFNPFMMKEYWSIMARYWVIISLFILGSTIFRKMALVKTALSFTIVVLLSTAVGLLFLRIFIALRVGTHVPLFEALASVDQERLYAVMGKIKAWKIGSQLLSYLIIPIALQLTAYFRLCEVEATDAV
jgi:hypothetical protein